MTSDYPSEEVDLRRILQPIFRQWIWIVLFVILCVATVISFSLFLTERKYVAESLIYINQTDYSVVPNSSIAPAFERPQIDNEAIERLALSDRVMRDTLNRLKDEASTSFQNWTLNSYRSGASATTSESGAILELAYEHGDPSVTAAVANTWASTLIHNFEALFGTESPRVETLRAQSRDLSDQLLELQQRLQNTATPGQATQIQMEINATQQVYESLMLTIAYVESGLGKSYELLFASPTEIPQQPVGRGLVRLSILTSFSSGLVAVLAILFMAFWNDDTNHRRIDGHRNGNKSLLEAQPTYDSTRGEAKPLHKGDN